MWCLCRSGIYHTTASFSQHSVAYGANERVQALRNWPKLVRAAEVSGILTGIRVVC